METTYKTEISLVHETFIMNQENSMIERMAKYIEELQNYIITGLEELEKECDGGIAFQRDEWERKDPSDTMKGYGCTGVIQKGQVFEKGGVNTSILHGILPPNAVQQMCQRKHLEFPSNKEIPFSVAGLSMVIHPKNPMAPTMHQNYRYFEIRIPSDKSDNSSNDNTKEQIVGWFGGGADLTPCYLFENDAMHWHTIFKNVLDNFNKDYYNLFKELCDEYFYLPHRKEHRGIGGTFFDDFTCDNNLEDAFALVRACGNATLHAYLPILRQRIHMSYTPEQKEWQEIRRGRYVEFNIMIDRGTKFGLATPNARIESILMTLPLVARWEYEHHPPTDSWEEKTVNILKNPKEWI